MIEENTPPVIPKTGDSSDMVIAMVMFLAGSAGFTIALNRGKSRKAN
ncbi:MAG: LPXTG cell wall anchor domain-containing protein [Oscillospiraceae bacterium]|nr:LPXTG cell wall anchor domain-containing protein [Oscillospiraceae bacterium]